MSENTQEVETQEALFQDEPYGNKEVAETDLPDSHPDSRPASSFNTLTTTIAGEKWADEEVVEGSIVRQSFQKLAQIQREFTKAQLDFVKDTVAKGLTEREVLMFLYKASKLGFDVLAGEMIAYVVSDKDSSRRQIVTITTRNGKRRKAYERAPIEYIKTEAIYRVKEQEGTYRRVQDWEGGELWGAECFIKRTDRSEVYHTIVSLEEYDSNKNAWFNKKSTMIKKVAQSQCLDDAVPELGGIYEPEEIDNNPSLAETTANVEIPETSTDQQPATPAQVNTITVMRQKLGKTDKLDIDALNQYQAKIIIRSLAQEIPAV